MGICRDAQRQLAALDCCLPISSRLRSATKANGAAKPEAKPAQIRVIFKQRRPDKKAAAATVAAASAAAFDVAAAAANAKSATSYGGGE
jgi:hypothetical protein